MPDGSSSAAPVINPGPRSAKKSSTGPRDWRCCGGWLAGAGIWGSMYHTGQDSVSKRGCNPSVSALNHNEPPGQQCAHHPQARTGLVQPHPDGRGSDSA